jgi:hypothetical protein
MWEIEAIVRSVIWQLVSKDYEGLVKRCPCSPMTADEIRSAIQQYGRTFIMPPTSGYERLLHTYQIENTEYPAWHIEAPLWTEQEGRSDLEISLRIELKDETPQITIRSVHVP